MTILHTDINRLRHDLRKPLTQILGYTELLLEDGPQDGGAEWLADLKEISGLGRDVLRLLEAEFPRSLADLTDGALTGLRSKMKQPLEAIDDLLGSISLRSSLPHSADIRKIRQANDLLIRFVIDGSLDDPVVQTRLDNQSATADVAQPHLLIVDDDSANRDLLARLLMQMKYRVSLADHGQAALELIEKGNYDLVLLDVLMPGIDGEEVLKRAKAARPELAVVVLSAFAEAQTAARCIEAGAEDYFIKPFEPALLRARIKAVLDRKRIRDGTIAQEQPSRT